eukprot:TRINITY_DN10426_c0_g2_i1.p1 TRINITY_DN10426_c0_g2~~TRINITY_DN10426_c0_g2_i1.p1  ORF type:complete len:104 (-),score=16.55 TRINITY_DN10426_c0_g2_i1:54-365(-)
MTALVLRIKFPSSYPLIYKTLRVDGSLSVSEAVQFIADSVNVQNLLLGSEGLYVPEENLWLDDNQQLSHYGMIQDVEHVEFKTRSVDIIPTPRKAKGGCCIML